MKQPIRSPASSRADHHPRRKVDPSLRRRRNPCSSCAEFHTERVTMAPERLSPPRDPAAALPIHAPVRPPSMRTNRDGRFGSRDTREPRPSQLLIRILRANSANLSPLLPPSPGRATIRDHVCNASPTWQNGPTSGRGRTLSGCGSRRVDG